MSKFLELVAYFRMLWVINHRPLDINIETTNICPLRCAFCCNRVYQRQRTIMDNILFENIVSQYYDMGGGAIGLSSMQSDLFSDPLLTERVKILKKYKKRLWIYTTTPLISCKRYSDKELLYILSIFDCLQISIEGHDQETYKTMGGIDGFFVLNEQLERIHRIIEDNLLAVRIDLCFRTYQKDELLNSDFYRKWSATFNVYNIKDTFFTWFGTIKEKDLPKGAKVIKTINSQKRMNCVIPNTSLAIMANGKAVGCGCIDWLSKYVIGDCKKRLLKEIWRGHRANKFRNAFQKGKIPSICTECDAYVPINSLKSRKYLKYQPTDGLYYLVRRYGIDSKKKKGR